MYYLNYSNLYISFKLDCGLYSMDGGNLTIPCQWWVHFFSFSQPNMHGCILPMHMQPANQTWLSAAWLWKRCQPNYAFRHAPTLASCSLYRRMQAPKLEKWTKRTVSYEAVGAWLHYRPVLLAYQPPASSIFLSEQTSRQQSVSITFLSEQISTSHQSSAKQTGYTSSVIEGPDTWSGFGKA
jgi:hypothetical protein